MHDFNWRNMIEQDLLPFLFEELGIRGEWVKLGELASRQKYQQDGKRTETAGAGVGGCRYVVCDSQV
jgi:hypothetical protein